MRSPISSPVASPLRATASLPPGSPPTKPPPLPARKTPPGGLYGNPRDGSPGPIFKPTHSYSPKRMSFGQSPRSPTTPPNEPSAGSEAKDDEDWDPPTTPAHAGRGANGMPRTVPLESAMTGPPRTPSPEKRPVAPEPAISTPTGVGAIHNGRMTVQLGPTSTRYGAALSGRTASPMAPMATGRQFGGSNPSCGKCGKTVYFAEQVRSFSFGDNSNRSDTVLGQSYWEDISP